MSSDIDEPTQAEKLNRVRTLREMGEKFDDVIRQFVVESKQSLPPDYTTLHEHLYLSPRFYDSYDYHVSAKIIGRMQHRLVAEYHDKPQLWMSPDILADFRKKMSKKVKKKWYNEK
ncbi:uncharacterized protein LOC131669389 isoform X2 [Phymastichus coffea]|uniref:uncharacterized protein LOC131669389 isoform X2 n=1 Tax=Phymastichus coffea TaxID=108790 RepID=UPI00273C5381|nr:uncharacterized protein LOC131669389 isoform X2 [Phymastichus coffea]